jgi:hypothetical protein
MRLRKSSVSVNSRTGLFLLAAIFLIGLSAVLGQVWAKKDFKEWSAKDCDKILSDSPWAKTQKMYASGGMGGSGTEGGEAFTEFTVQLLSALPIRQAMVQQKQLPETFLTAEFPDKVIVRIKYRATAGQQTNLDLAQKWQNQTLGTMQVGTYLIGTKGVKVPLEKFEIAPGAGQMIQLTFPRQKDGKDVLSTEDKSLIVQFSYPVVGGMGDGKGYFEFKVKDMVYNGQIAY